MRDPLHKGIEAAEVWRRAYNKARAEFELTKGACEMNITGVRLDPLNPCNLQVEFDGNNNWTTVADLSKCGGGTGGCDCVYRFNGTNVQKWDDCENAWVDAGPAYDPTTDTPIPKGVQLPQGSRCDAAANVAAEVERIADLLSQAYDDGATLFEGATTLAGIVGVFGAPTFVLATFVAALEALLGIASDTWEQAHAYDATVELRQAIYAGIGDDGVYTLDGYKQTLDKWSEDAEFLIDGEQLKKGLIFAMLVAIGPYVLSQWNRSHGITGTDCSADEWEQTFNFEHLISTAWTRPTNYTKKYGVQTDAGWTAEHYNNPAGYYTALMIGIGFQSTNITGVRVLYNAEIGVNDDGAYPVVRVVALADVPATAVPITTWLDSATLVEGTDQSALLEFDDTLTGIAVEFGVASDTDGVAPVNGSGTIKRIVIKGTGINPFTA
jgi:hypothetical protein